MQLGILVIVINSNQCSLAHAHLTQTLWVNSLELLAERYVAKSRFMGLSVCEDSS